MDSIKNFKLKDAVPGISGHDAKELTSHLVMWK